MVGVSIPMVKNVLDTLCLKITVSDVQILILLPCREGRRDETSSYIFTSD